MAAKLQRNDRRPRYLAVILIALLLLRWWLGTLPGYPHDLSAYKRWALVAGLQGVHTVYDDPATTYDYPPLYAYLLAPLGKLYATLAPDATRDCVRTRAFGDSPLFSVLVKLPPLAFDLLIALLLGTLAWRFGMWPRNTARGWWPALLYLFLPAVLFDSGYWGQPDAVHTFSILLGLTLILVGKPELGWVSAALACLMKPLALPYLPLLALATLVRSGWRRLVTGGLCALGTAVVILLPFILTGRGALTIQRLVSDVGAMPYTSINAHNIWWLLGPWRPASAAWLGPLTPTTLGLGLFAIVYALLLWRILQIERARAGGRMPLARGPEPLSEARHWYLAAATIAFSFFVFSTHMHENHLFTILPFLVLLAATNRRWMILTLLVSLAVLVNMATHDYYLAQDVWSRIGGASTYFHPDFNRPLSWLEFGVANANAVFILLLFAWFIRLGWWGRLAGRGEHD